MSYGEALTRVFTERRSQPLNALEHTAEFARACQQRADEKRITFCQAMNDVRSQNSFSAAVGRLSRKPVAGIAVDPKSVEFAQECQKRADEKRITFGQAMQEIREERSSQQAIARLTGREVEK
jgi:hypothetical protein